MRIVLASNSPRRAAILRDAQIPFETLPANIDESGEPNEPPERYTLRLAEAKARRTAARVHGPAIVVGADTVVAVDGTTIVKPASPDHARDILRLLSGRSHDVITGIAAIRIPDGAARVEAEKTRVTFAPLSDEEIEACIASGEPMDKAGAYAIQGQGGRYVTRIEGCYFNVAGLPLARLYHILRDLGWRSVP